MSDEPASKRDWAIPFVGRLCLISWVCAILYECFSFLPPVRWFSLTFGPWACVIALLNGMAFLLMRRQGIFLVFVLLTLPPTVHFGFVLRNIAVEKKWIKPGEYGSPITSDPAEKASEQKPVDAAINQ